MPRFYLNLRDHDEFWEDDVGQSLRNLGDAVSEAIESGREILAQRIRFGRGVDGGSIEIADEEGAVLRTVNFRDLLS